MNYEATPVAPESTSALAAVPASEPAAAAAPETPAQPEAAPEAPQTPAEAPETPAQPEAAPEAPQTPAEAPALAASPETQAAADELVEQEAEVERVEEYFEVYETPEDHPSRKAPGLRPTPAGPETPAHDDENRA